MSAVVEQLGHLGAGERSEPDGDGVRRTGAQMTVVLLALLALRAHRAQQLHRRALQAAGGEAEQFGAGRIQPLQVVGDDQDRPPGGERAQRGEHREAQCEAVAQQAGLAPAGERRLQGGALGEGQSGGDLVEHQAEEVGEGQEGKVGFGLRGGAAQHGARTGAVFLGQCPQDRGFPYSGRAVEQRTAARGESVARRREQVLAADEQVGAASGRLLEVPSHGHRSPRVSCPGQILGNDP